MSSAAERAYWDNVTDFEMGGPAADTPHHIDLVTPSFLPNAGTVLEIGCGVGRLTSALADMFLDASFIGFDPSVSLLKRARYQPNVYYLSELPDRKFDYIYSMLVFQHIPNEEKNFYINYIADHVNIRTRFQYVRGWHDGFNDYNVMDETVIEWCDNAGLDTFLWQDDVHPEWSWVEAWRRK